MLYNQALPLINLIATSAPTINDDIGRGYQTGSLWSYSGILYQCMNPSLGTAIWLAVTGSNEKTFEFTITGDGVTTVFSFVHGLNNDWLHVTVKRNDGVYSIFEEDGTAIEMSGSLTTLTFTFFMAPTVGYVYKIKATGQQKTSGSPGAIVGSAIVGSTFVG